MSYEQVVLTVQNNVVLNQDTFDSFFDVIDYREEVDLIPSCEFSLYQSEKKVELSEERIVWVIFGCYSINSIEKIVSQIAPNSKLYIATGISYDNFEKPNDNDLEKINQWVSNDRVEFLFCNDIEGSADKCSKSIDRLKFDGWRPLLDVGMLGNAPDALQKFYGRLGELLNKDKVMDNTKDKNNRTYLENALINLPLILEGHKIDQAIKNYDHRPVVLVSAGPSLVKQLPLLKKYQHLFTIIAATATYPNLLKFEIEPDYLIAVDVTNKVVWDRSLKGKLILDAGCDPSTVWDSPEKSLICAHTRIIQDLLNHLGVKVDVLPTGGSVATSAFTFAKLLGSNPIVMIGQDLAYSNGKKRTDGYAFDLGEFAEKINHENTFYVDAYGGQGKIETDAALLLFKTWFENEIKLSTGVTFINSTEGGAEINGAASLPFAMVCEELEKFNLPRNEWALTRRDDQVSLGEVINNLESFMDEIKEQKLTARKGVKLTEKMRSGKLPVDFSLIDEISHKLKSASDQVKHFCEGYSSVIMREVQRNIVREEDSDEKKAASYYMNIYYLTEQSAKEALAFLARARDFYVKINNVSSNKSYSSKGAGLISKFSRID